MRNEYILGLHFEFKFCTLDPSIMPLLPPPKPPSPTTPSWYPHPFTTSPHLPKHTLLCPYNNMHIKSPDYAISKPLALAYFHCHPLLDSILKVACSNVSLLTP